MISDASEIARQSLPAGRQKLLFITWAENCSRSDSIARRLEGKSYLVYSPFWGSRYLTVAFKYLSQSLKTLRILLRDRPQTVVVMTPPVIACIPVWIYVKLTGGQYAIDAHSGALIHKRWTRILFLHRFFSKKAVATLVTSEFLGDIVRGWGARAQIVADVPVYFPEPSVTNLGAQWNMVFVSTFTPDEPLEAFLTAAAQVSDVQFYVTGRLNNADPAQLNKAPANVTFTDFLSDSEYVGLLVASDAVICLTTEDHTMQRGGYEAIYLCKPIITSDFALLRQAFSRGAVHVSSDPDEIAGGIRQMKDNLEKYRREAEELRLTKLKCWEDVAMDLNRLFGWSSQIT